MKHHDVAVPSELAVELYHARAQRPRALERLKRFSRRLTGSPRCAMARVIAEPPFSKQRCVLVANSQRRESSRLKALASGY